MRIQGRQRLRWSDLRQASYLEQKTEAIVSDVLRKPSLPLKPLTGRKHLSRAAREAASRRRQEAHA